VSAWESSEYTNSVPRSGGPGQASPGRVTGARTGPEPTRLARTAGADTPPWGEPKERPHSSSFRRPAL